MNRRFFGAFLYGTSSWNAAALLFVAVAYALLGLWLQRAGVGAAVRIGTLTGFVILMGIAVLLYYGKRQATMTRSVDRETLRAEVETKVVHELQEALTHQNLPTVSNMGFSATYLPASVDSKIGGDWYDAFELPHGRIMFSIGDVSGHGIEAAATMSRARQAIIAAALHDSDPASILTRANTMLLRQATPFATAICGFVDPATLRVYYATAGHPPAILIDGNGSATLLQYGGIPLGVLADCTYTTFEVAAAPDSMLVLYTDGATEYDHNIIEGERRMLSTAAAIARGGASNPAQAIRDAIFAEYKPQDDVAILTIAFRDHAATYGVTSSDGDEWAVSVRGVREPFESETSQ